MSSLDDTQRLVERAQAGDQKARSELLKHACNRLQMLAPQMLKGYPVVHRWEQTGDVVQKALLRLAKALEQVQLQSACHFHRLAALQVRRELIDLARHYSGPEGLAANHDTDSHDPEHGVLACQPSRTAEPSTVAEWSDLHLAVEKLPEDEREVIDLIFYQGLTQKEAALILAVTERTVQRRWVSARCHLDQALKR